MLFRAAATALERRSAEWGNTDPPPPGAAGGVPAAGTLVSEGTSMQIAAVYGSVSFIANQVATLPLELFSSPDPSKRRLLEPGPLLTEPFAEIDLMDWLVQFALSLALRGNFYGHIIERDAQLYATQIRPVHPDRATVRRVSVRGQQRLEYRFDGKLVPLDDVVHRRYLTTPGSVVGLNPIAYMRHLFGLARAQELYGGKFYENSAAPGGYISVEDELDDEDVVRLAKAWMNIHQGLGGAHMPGVLTGGAKFEPITIKPEDAQFIESRGFTEEQIVGRIFHIPLHFLGMQSRSTSWGTGIAEQSQGWVTNTLVSYLGRGERMFTALQPQDGRYVKFRLKERLRGDLLKRYQAYGLGIAGGFLCPDDAREDDDRAPLPEDLGKTFLVPINSQTIKQAVAETIDPSATRPPADQGGSDA